MSNSVGTKREEAQFDVRQISSPSQADTLKLCKCSSISIRSFHITWITFFWCFFAWFSTTNVSSDDFTPLTWSQQQLAGSLSVTSTIIFRIIIAALCPKYGSRKSYIVVLVSTMITLIALSLVQTPTGYIIAHFFLGIAGASFVVTQYHTTRLFAGNIVGLVQAMSAGFGNFGGGVVNFIAPLCVYYFNISWRIFLIGVAIILFILCFIYYFGSTDNPIASAGAQNKASISFIRPGSGKGADNLVGGFFSDAFYDYRTWVLFACYAASAGVEFMFYLVAAHYFEIEFNLHKISSGLIVMIWSFINVIARPFGGYLCDKYNIPKRAKILFAILFCESIFLILFGVIGNLSLTASIISSLLFSVCIQMAEGATYSIVAFIQPKSAGYVIGIVAAGANFGAAFFMFVIFLPWGTSKYRQKYSWVVLGIVVMIISFCALMIQFTNRELHDSNQNMAACYDLEFIKTKQKIDMTQNDQLKLQKDRDSD